MDAAELEETVVKGILTLGNHILISPEHSELRSELLDQSRVLITRNVILYIDDKGTFRNPNTGQDEVAPTAFMSIMTPLCDISVSFKKIYNIVYKNIDKYGVLPHEIDLEEVLNEVDRVAFAFDDEFSVDRVLRYSRQRSNPLFKRSQQRVKA